jgi:crotonobetainyl-CoA:carnitine CoA-transferase CaiB-like acyl-CoA transferase
MSAALAISAALVRQQAVGDGDLIDVSLLDTDIALMAPRIAAYLAGEPEPAPSGGTDSVLAVYQTFKTADREIVVAIGNDTMWQRFCSAVQLHELGSNPALRDNAGRRANRAWITEVIGDRLSQRIAAEWLKVLSEAEVPSSLVQRLSEVVEDPQIKARGIVLPVPGSDRLCAVRSPFRLRSIPEPHNGRYPELGAHTCEVLREMGLPARRIAELAESGAIQLRRDRG